MFDASVVKDLYESADLFKIDLQSIAWGMWFFKVRKHNVQSPRAQTLLVYRYWFRFL